MVTFSVIVMKRGTLHLERTPEFPSRRRALFPCNENSVDPDLESIRPLDEHTSTGSHSCSLGDYDIIGLLEEPKDVSVVVQTPSHKINIEHPLSPNVQINRTPHDISTNLVLPKLLRKTGSVIDSDIAVLEPKKSKVRTALFPEFQPFSSKSFYPKVESASHHSICAPKRISGKVSHKKDTFYLCNRKNRSKFGQINSGVRHKIKKTKQKLKSSASLKRAAFNIIDRSPLKQKARSDNPSFKDDSEEQFFYLPEESKVELKPKDTSKKFFKYTHTKGTVTMSKNVKLEVINGKISLLPPKENKMKRPSNSSNESTPKRTKFSEFDNEIKEPFVNTTHITNIIHSLANNEEDKENDTDILMSPTSQMCNMASGLVLNSPQRGTNLSFILDQMSDSSKEPAKLFPVFHSGKTSAAKEQMRPAKINVKKLKPISKSQMLLDAGQKKFGAVQCPQCNIIYHAGDPSDELLHQDYHSSEHIFRFKGWKNERIVGNYLSKGRIIQIMPGDSKIWWKKLKDVIDVIDQNLGFNDIETVGTFQVFLYVKNNIIVGFMSAEPKTLAYKLITEPENEVDLCSEESQPIKCGISRIWVSPNYRRKGVGTALMNCIKKNFIFGCILRDEDLAFSSLTENGKLFGKKYFNSNVLIYLN